MPWKRMEEWSSIILELGTEWRWVVSFTGYKITRNMFLNYVHSNGWHTFTPDKWHNCKEFEKILKYLNIWLWDDGNCSSQVSAIKVQKWHYAIGQGNSTETGTQPWPSALHLISFITYMGIPAVWNPQSTFLTQDESTLSSFRWTVLNYSSRGRNLLELTHNSFNHGGYCTFHLLCP
jgi:hypothetical protein